MPNKGFVNLVFLSEDRLCIAANNILNVYLLSDLTMPLANYQVCKEGWIVSSLIDGNHLYLSLDNAVLYVFEITCSLSQPLKPLPDIITKNFVRKMLRVGHELLLGEENGHL